ncbi:MAG: glycoside hydrolase family 3 N-terminal domain-containing protein [Nonlabens sp.]
MIIIVLVVSCKEQPVGNDGPTQEEILTQKADSLLAMMTLEEKIGQMTQIRHFWDMENDTLVARKLIGSVIHTDGGNPGQTAADWQKRFNNLQRQALSTRLGIPLLFGVDAVHGQNTFDGATIFPHNIGMGATGDISLVERAAQITAIESRATGFNWVFSPCVAVPFNERWGRVYEAFSEDSAMVSAMTAASIRGHQMNLSAGTSVMATAKHFIGDGATDYGKEGGNTAVSDSIMNNILLPPYRAAINNNVGAVMASFNAIDSLNMHAHKELITDTLKNKLGFEGIVLTDWKGYSRFGRNAVVNAGVDMFMAVDGDMEVFQQGVKRGVESDSISTARIDDAVRRILKKKFALNLFEKPFADSSLIKSIGSSKHRAVAREAVRNSMVLLKNEILPLNKTDQKIVVVGEHANNSGLQSGGWTIRWQGREENYAGATTILQGFEKLAPGNVVYDQDASKKVKDAYVAVIVVGETPYAEFMGDVGHEVKKYQLTLTDVHKSYIKTYNDLDIPVVVVLISGRPLVVTEEIKKSAAFIAAWLPGSEGDGVAQVIMGEYDFKGKLPHSWPASTQDFKGKYGPNFWQHNVEPLYPLGYGLSY